MFAYGSEFEVSRGEDRIRTVMDLEARDPSLRRRFRFVGRLADQRSFPFLMFNARGQLAFPPVYLDSYHHAGLVEAASAASAGDGRFEVPGRVYLGFQTSPETKRELPRAELVRINPHHGRTVALTK
jgi:hypothetical protein